MNKDKNRNSEDHSGHRRRKRQALLSSGAGSMTDVDILEMLLYYAVQRADTRPIAQGLLERFGSLQAVLSGDIKEIVKITGLKDNAAVLFTLFKEVNKRLNPSNAPLDLLDHQKVKRFLIDLYKDSDIESVYALYFDGGGTMVGKQIVFRGNVGSVRFSLRTITEGVIKCGGTSVVLAHNHPSGILVPSNDDILTTNHIAAHLNANDINFIEHYIVGKDDCVGILSMK